ncbi:polysaccharide biosynthesis tyrosine autokinase [Chitinivorax sp. PXF-14]|uniref:polysaccharide biosynthesis tyrosine autokinase n=1 Tax=Chitinivorax sp. PXF-14 TaxID=3230488 RepID=UPI0034676E50
MNTRVNPSMQFDDDTASQTSAQNSLGGSAALGRILIDSGKLKREDIDKITAAQQEQGLRFGEAAVKLGLVREADILQGLSKQFSFSWIEPSQTRLSTELSVLHDPFSREAEALRTLRGHLLLRWFGNGNKFLAVGADDRGSGVTHTAANLAVLFAQAGLRTVLVDGNLRFPRVTDIFGALAGSGLTEWLAGRGSQGLPVAVPEVRNLSLIPAGAVPPNPQELLARPRFFDVLNKLGEYFDVVLVDCPAAQLGADYEMIASRCRGTIVVSHQDNAHIKRLSQLSADMRASGVEICGGVLNRF